MLQFGLIGKWTTDVMRQSKQELFKRKKRTVMEYQNEKEEGVILALTLLHMQGPIVLYLIGNIVSFIALLSENVICACKNHNFKQGRLQQFIKM